ncbi:MAG TPA: aminopeptidase P N-terminal domain-containing protein, partial [Stenomitos sp.]
MDFNLYPALSEALAQRRQKLSLLLPDPVLLWSGRPSPRNFAANVFPFRASSHFLYFAGLPLQDAVIHLHQGEMTLFMDAPTPEDQLWHGEMPTPSQVAEAIGASTFYPLAELRQVGTAATLPVQDPTTRAQQSWVLGRAVEEPSLLDQALAEALVQLRLVQDDMAIAAIREAAHVSVKAHLAGMAQTCHARSEAQVRAAIEAEMIAANMTP